MRLSIVLLAIITSASAFPANELTKRATAPAPITICDRIGKKCKASEKPLCCDPAGPLGFAHCVNGKVKLTKCKDGCGSEDGIIQCIANPVN